MSDTLSLAAFTLLSPSEQDSWMRRAVTRVVKPGEQWKHDANPFRMKCSRCGTECYRGDDRNCYMMPTYNQSCPIPPEAAGSWADCAELLREQLAKRANSAVRFGRAFKAFRDAFPEQLGYISENTLPSGGWLWMALDADPRDRVKVLLLALGMITVEEGKK